MAQPYDWRFDRISVNDGLVQSAVHDIIEDRYGYIWFGTRGGLSRYDGTEFVNYVKDDQDSTSISNSSIWSLLEWEDGDLWIGTSGGLNRFDRTSQKFDLYFHTDLSNNNIWSIHEWNRDSLLIGTQMGVFLVSISTKDIVRSRHLLPMDSLSVFSIVERNDGSILFGTNNGIYVFEDESLGHYQVGSVRSLHEDHIGRIWIIGSGKILVLGSDLKEIQNEWPVSIGEAKVKIVSNTRNQIIVGGGGIRIYGMEGDLLQTFKNNTEKPYSISANSITSVCIDKNGIYWFGTNGYGINKYDPRIPLIGYLGSDLGTKSALTSDYISSVYTPDDTMVWIGTNSGLNLHNMKVKESKRIRLNYVEYVGGKGKEVWVALFQTLLRYDGISGELKDEYQIERLRRTRAIVKDEKGYLWIGCELGIVILDPESYKYKIIVPPSTSQRRQTEDWITAIAPFDSQTMLVGSVDGIFTVDIQSEELIVDSSYEFQDHFQDVYIKSINPVSNDQIWFGTWGDGAFKFDKANGSIKKFTRSDGLPDDVVYGIIEDDQGYLWMSTNRGLSRYDPRKNSFFNVDVSYGLQSEEFNTTAYFKSINNNLYFGGIAGLNYFDPSKFIENTRPPETIITKLTINGQTMTGFDLGYSKPIMEIDTLRLEYYQNMLEVEFKGSNMTLSKFNNYAYYLENLEDNWNEVGNRQFGTYTSIPPGEYILNVKSSNNDGYWDPDPAQLVIQISPPFWQTIWFRIMVFSLILILVYTLYRTRIRYLRRTQRMLEQQVTQRTEALNQSNSQLNKTNEELSKTIEELHDAQEQLIQTEKMASLGVLSAGVGHEINNPLNYIKNGVSSLENELRRNPEFISNRMEKFLEIINDGVSRTSGIVRSLSHFSRQGGKLDEECDLHDIIDNCLVILHNKIKRRIKLEKEYSRNEAKITGSEGKLHQAILNILSNAEQAIGESKGIIRIETVTDNNSVKVIIQDSGIGIRKKDLNRISDPFFTTKPPGVGTGLGLSIAYNIVDEHQGSVKVSSKVGEGSVFTLTFPTLQPADIK